MTAARAISSLLLLVLAGCIPFGDAWFKFGGTVTDPSGQPIPGARLSISVDGKPLEQDGSVLTDAQGHYKFFDNSCPCDFDFRLDVTAPGFKPYILELSGKEANQLTEKNITLQPQ